MEVSSSGQEVKTCHCSPKHRKGNFNTSCELFVVTTRGSHAYIVRKLEY